MVNFNTLKYAVTVAEELSFTKASQRLYISQSSLSQSIQLLENKLGTPLFDRKTSPLTITHAGTVYISWAKTVLLSQIQIRKQLRSISSSNRTRLVIGSSPHRGALLLPEVLKVVAHEFPDCDICIEEGSASELLARIDTREIDVFIGDEREDAAKYISIPVADEQLILGVPKIYNKPEDALNVKFRSYPSISLFSLKEIPFIMLSPQYFLGYTFRTLCEQEDFTPIYGIECQRVEMAHSLVSQGLGVTLIPEFYVRLTKKLPDVDYFTINGRTVSRSLAIVYSNGTKLSEPANRFVEVFLEKFKDINIKNIPNSL